MSDFVIMIEELEVKMYLGLHDFEKNAMQRVLISATIHVTGLAGNNSSFFDYDRITDFIRTYAGKRVDTQEELVRDIHTFITGFDEVTSATVSSKKPGVYSDCTSVGLTYSG